MLKIVEKDAVCRITRDGKTVFECPVAFDPQAALNLLREINSLKDAQGTPIYAKYLEREIPIWAMVPEHLFWSYLQPFIKYRPVLDWISSQPREAIETAIHDLDVWHKLLTRPADGAPGGSSLAARLRHWLEEVFLVVNAAVVGGWSRWSGTRFVLWSLNSVWGDRWFDYRLKDVYGELWKERVPFVEGFPFPGFKIILKRLFGSRRIVFYAPNILRVVPEAYRVAEHFAYDTQPVGSMPAAQLQRLIERIEVVLANVRLHARLLTRLFRIAGVRRVIGIDEHTSFASLICAARSLGIETVGLQHGVFHKYSIGWTTPGIPHEFTCGYDQILVWGEFWRKLLCELSSTYREEQLLTAGFIRPSTVSLKHRSSEPPRGEFRILLPYEFLANPEEIAGFVHAFLDRGFKVFFKVRFDDTLDEQLRMLPREKLELVPELTQELLDSIHVCAGTSTTMMYELYYLGVPSWFIETKHDSNIHITDHGLGAKITLAMLKSADFDPWSHLIAPSNPEYIFSAGGIPASVVTLSNN